MKHVPPAAVYRILHLWSLTPEHPGTAGEMLFKSLQIRGYYSLLSLSQAISEVTASAEILLVSDRLHQIESLDTPYPEKQSMVSVCQVIPQELPRIKFRCVELDPSWMACSLEEAAT